MDFFLKLISMSSIKVKLEAFFFIPTEFLDICIIESINHSDNIEMPLISQQYFKEIVKYKVI